MNVIAEIIFRKDQMLKKNVEMCQMAFFKTKRPFFLCLSVLLGSMVFVILNYKIFHWDWSNDP